MYIECRKSSLLHVSLSSTMWTGKRFNTTEFWWRFSQPCVSQISWNSTISADPSGNCGLPSILTLITDPLCCGEGGSGKKEKNSSSLASWRERWMLSVRTRGVLPVISDGTLTLVGLLRSTLVKTEGDGMKDLAS